MSKKLRVENIVGSGIYCSPLDYEEEYVSLKTNLVNAGICTNCFELFRYASCQGLKKDTFLFECPKCGHKKVVSYKDSKNFIWNKLSEEGLFDY